MVLLLYELDLSFLLLFLLVFHFSQFLAMLDLSEFIMVDFKLRIEGLKLLLQILESDVFLLVLVLFFCKLLVDGVYLRVHVFSQLFKVLNHLDILNGQILGYQLRLKELLFVLLSHVLDSHRLITLKLLYLSLQIYILLRQSISLFVLPGQLSDLILKLSFFFGLIFNFTFVSIQFILLLRDLLVQFIDLNLLVMLSFFRWGQSA